MLELISDNAPTAAEDAAAHAAARILIFFVIVILPSVCTYAVEIILVQIISQYIVKINQKYSKKTFFVIFYNNSN